MTRGDKIAFTLIILTLVAIVVFWKDVRAVLGSGKESVVEEQPKKKDKDKKDKIKKKKDKDEDDKEAFSSSPNTVWYA